MEGPLAEGSVTEVPPTVVVLRVWLPDRPGALGAVASRIGAVRGDLLAIDVLERGGGRAVDELTVALPEEGLIDLLVSEIGQVDGVDVEDVRPATGGTDDRAVRALSAARTLASTPRPDDIPQVLASTLLGLLGADWAVMEGPPGRLASAGSGAPDVAWLGAFIAGSNGTAGSVDELAVLAFGEDHDHHVVISRAHLPLREVELLVVAELLEIAATHQRVLAGGSRPVA